MAINRNRRQILRTMALAGGGVGLAALAGCGETQIVEREVVKVVKEEVPVEVERVVTQVVEKAVEVERVVTQIVEKAVEVEKVVEKERVVEKVVTVEVEAPKIRAAKIGLWMQEWKDGVAAMDNAIANFQAQFPHYTVEMTPIPYGDLLSKFYPSIVAGTASEVVYTYTDWWYPIDVTKVLHPLTPNLMTRAELQSIFFSRSLDAVWSSDGQFYVIPLINGIRGPVVVADVAAIEEAGISDLDASFETWDGFEAIMARTLQKEGDKITRNGIHLSSAFLGHWAQSYIMQRGGTYYDVETNTFDFNIPEARESLQFFVELYNRYTSLVSQENATPALIKKSSVFETSGLFMVSVYAGLDPELHAEPFAVPAFPGANELLYQTSSTGSLTVPKFVKDEKLDAAFEFMRHMWQPENMAQFGQFYSGSQTVRQVYELPAYLESKFGWASAKMMPNTVWPAVRYPPFHINHLENNFIGKAIQDVADQGHKSIEQMADDLTNDVNAVEKEAVARIQAGN